MWTEKYRPGRLEDLAGQDDTKRRLALLVKKKEELPHLLFIGPPGSGKTTAALIIAREMLGEAWMDYTLMLNSSDERGIDTIREKVKTFARFSDRREGIPFRFVILDEFDETTPSAQTALRRIMEESAAHTRFCLIANFGSGIIEPIQSRCAIFRFQTVGEKEMGELIKKIALMEKVEMEEEAMAEIYRRSGGDVRQAINLLQMSVLSGRVSAESVKTASGATPRSKASEIIRTALSGNFETARSKLIELTRVYGVSANDFMRFINDSVWEIEPTKASEVIRIISEYDYRLVQGSNQDIQLTAMLAELAALKS